MEVGINFIMLEQATSQVEKHFITSSVYKRSRRYFDINKLNQIEHLQEVSRRMPLRTNETIESHVDGSFISSQELLKEKVHHDLDYFHTKAHADDADELETTYTAATHRARTVDMRKMLARSDFGLAKSPYRNEQQFNNYAEEKRKPRTSLDFDHFLGRNPKSARLSLSGHNEPDPEKIGKTHEKMLFDQSHLRCFVNYHKNGRVREKREEEPLPVYELKKIQKGEDFTRKSVNANQLEFYFGTGKESPAQLDNRLLKENEYFWRNIKEERARLKDFSVNKRREDQTALRLESILNKKKVVEERNEVCDEKYFRRGHE